MGTWNAIYLSGELSPGFRPLVEGTCPVRRIDGWVELALPGVTDGEATARALARSVEGPVHWILLQTTASVLSVMHVEKGEPIRRIETADLRWLRVEGTPQPWEDWLFDEQQLAEALEIDGDDDGVRAAFARRTLEVGATWPQPDAWEALVRVLGVEESAWRGAQAAPPFATIEGARTSAATHLARALLVASALALLFVFLSREPGWSDVRAVLGSLAVVGLFVAFVLGLRRKALVGRWFT